MATSGWNPRVHVFALLFVMVFSFAAVVHARTEENSFVVSRHSAEGSLNVVVGGASPCDSAVEVQSDEPLIQSVTSEDAADVASNLSKGPCIRQTTMSCPVKCFRSYPVCGTDKVTYWCGAADANCAGVEVAHDGFCNLWEGDKNVGSTTALYAVQSLQLVHMLWLVFAGSFIVLGML